MKDELAATICGMNIYREGKGSDRQNILKVWVGAPITFDRVSNEFREPVRIHHPHLGIVGNLPPAMPAEMVNPRGDDGFIDRWLFVFP